MRKGFMFAPFLLLSISLAVFAQTEPNRDYPMRHGMPVGGYRLGIVVSEVNPQMKDELRIDSGVIVNQVMHGSAADKAGIRKGDVILSINGDRVEDANDVREIMGSMEKPQQMEIDLIRDGKDMKIAVTPDKQRNSFFGGMPRTHLGVELQDLDQNLSSYFKVAPDAGVLIVRVENGSPAEKAGLQSGDVVTECNGKKVGSARDLMDTVRDLQEDESADLTVLRHGSAMKFTVQPERRMGDFEMPQMP
ncbi:MAG: hypothetical protein C5B54_12075, partial [Acidobacteria bacterium]